MASSSNVEIEMERQGVGRLPEEFANILEKDLHDFHCKDGVTEGKWSTPLQVSASKGDSDAVQVLLQYPNVRAHVNDAMDGGLTALHLAVKHDHIEIAQMLVLNGAKDQADSSGQVALHYAAKEGNLKMVEILCVQNYEPFQLALALSFTIGVDGNPNVSPNATILNDKWDDRINIAKVIVDSRKVPKSELSGLLAMLNGIKLPLNDMERIWRIKKVLEDALEKEEAELLREMFRNMENVRAMANGIMVTAALFATVAFTGFLQPPHGTVDKNTAALRTFFVMNSFSFYFAVATILASLSMLTPSGEELKTSNVDSILRSITIVSSLLLPVVLFGVGSFVSAGFAALPHSYEALNIITCVLGSIISIIPFCTFIFYKILPIWHARTSRKELSESKKKSESKNK